MIFFNISVICSIDLFVLCQVPGRISAFSNFDISVTKNYVLFLQLKYEMTTIFLYRVSYDKLRREKQMCRMQTTAFPKVLGILVEPLVYILLSFVYDQAL